MDFSGADLRLFHTHDEFYYGAVRLDSDVLVAETTIQRRPSLHGASHAVRERAELVNKSDH
jgi:hypothetical protein